MTEPFNASDTRSIRRAARLAKQAEAERRGVILNLMSSPAGRNWMYERLVRCHIFSASFALQALAMAFAEGERNVGLQDLNDIMQFAPDQYIQMTREANDRSIAADSGHLRDNADGGRPDSRRPEDAGIPGTVEHEYDPGADGEDA